MFSETPADSPHDPLFDSAWLKWGRAVVHAQALQADLDSFGPDGSLEPTFAVRTEYHPKRHGFGVYISDIDPMPVTWGLLLGDIANNLRSALDQLAWALVTRGRTPPDSLPKKRRRQIYFPVADERDKFNALLGNNLPGVRRADLAIVRRYQPYHRSSRGGRWFALLLLADINAADKHRTVQPIWGIPITADIQVTYQRDCVISQRDSWAIRQPLEVGAELALVRVRKTGPDPHIEVKPHLTSEPTFKGRVLMREWLKVAIWWVQWLLYEFSEPPAEIAHIGIDIERFKAVMAWAKPTFP